MPEPSAVTETKAASQAGVRGLYVTGTDRGVGQTLVACGLARALRNRGLRVAVIKPVETGCALAPDAEVPFAGMSGTVDAEQLAAMERLRAIAGPEPPSHSASTPPEALVAADALALREAAGTAPAVPLELTNPFRYASPLDPAVAARLADRPIDLDRILGCITELAREADVVIADGDGGPLAPLNDHALTADLIARSGLAALLVGRSATGTVSQTLLCLEALDHRQVPRAGVLLNRLTDQPPSPEEAGNVVQIEAFAGEVVRATLPFFNRQRRDDLDQLADRFRVHLDVVDLLRSIGVPTPDRP